MNGLAASGRAGVGNKSEQQAVQRGVEFALGCHPFEVELGRESVAIIRASDFGDDRASGQRQSVDVDLGAADDLNIAAGFTQRQGRVHRCGVFAPLVCHSSSRESTVLLRLGRGGDMSAAMGSRLCGP